jgi:hypothetical protein
MNLLTAVVLGQVAVSAQTVRPVLAFPEPPLDDSAAYEGYRTRFFRDAAGNAVQIYINQRDGRVVNLWADAANASASFTARAAQARPARVTWGSDEARIGVADGGRYVEYGVRAESAPLEIGRIVLGSMRLERDFQYGKGHLAPFGAAGIEQPELVELIALLERLDSAEQRRHLGLLRARSPEELRGRLRPSLRQSGGAGRRVIVAEQQTFDGRNRLSLQLTFENGAAATLDTVQRMISVRGRSGEPIVFLVRIGSDAPTLSVLEADDIFNADFLRFYGGVRSADSAGARFRRLDRQIRSAELVSYEEKLMAGLPNYATYFGRDMIMSALMLEPVWTHGMIEHVIASVLRKLAPSGEVSHEEALGGQAIRENAAVYNGLLRDHFRATDDGQRVRADSLLGTARAVLADLQAVRENYNMVDDDFQFPVLVARYLGNAGVPAERKVAFLQATDGVGGGTRLERLLRNLAFVARAAEAYAREPIPTNLVSFRRRAEGGWSPGSWRDSGAGYAGGRFALDVNAIWVPAALQATDTILATLAALGVPVSELLSRAAAPDVAALLRYRANRSQLRAAIESWRNAGGHFVVSLTPEEVRTRAQAWLAALPPEERSYWGGRYEQARDADGVRFLAVALDSAGRPIPVMNTDPATRLFLEDLAASRRGEALAELETLLLPYPHGLFVPELGPLVASDVYADATVQARFRDDLYHSPRVVWGREVNLLTLGLARQIAASYDEAGRLRDPALEPFVRRLAAALARTTTAVEASGLKHNELWSYRIDAGRLLPIRYGASTDIQLWNLTDLAVQFALSRLPAEVAPLRR